MLTSDTSFSPTRHDLLFDISIALGLAPPRADQALLRESDHGIIDKTLTNSARSLLARGWWFNTDYYQELEPDQITRYIVLSGVIRLGVYRFQPWGLAPNLILQPSAPGADTSQLFNTDDQTLEFDHSVWADVIWGYDVDFWPTEFRDYMQWKVVNKLAPIFGAPSRPDEQTLAWNQLIRAENDQGRRVNNIDDNPINYLSVRS